MSDGVSAAMHNTIAPVAANALLCQHLRIVLAHRMLSALFPLWLPMVNVPDPAFETCETTNLNPQTY
jgi:hypothetical protein